MLSALKFRTGIIFVQLYLTHFVHFQETWWSRTTVTEWSFHVLWNTHPQTTGLTFKKQYGIYQYGRAQKMQTTAGIVWLGDHSLVNPLKHLFQPGTIENSRGLSYLSCHHPLFSAWMSSIFIHHKLGIWTHIMQEWWRTDKFQV